MSTPLEIVQWTRPTGETRAPGFGWNISTGVQILRAFLLPYLPLIIQRCMTSLVSVQCFSQGVCVVFSSVKCFQEKNTIL